MAYNWAQLAFVEKWRLQAVRGAIIGMQRPADKTYFDFRLKPGEINGSTLPGSVDLRLLDAGDIIREKRIALLDKTSVVVRVVGEIAPRGVTTVAGRRPLDSGSTANGNLASVDGDVAVLDMGFAVVVQLAGPPTGVSVGSQVTVTVCEPPKGFLVV